MKIDEKGGCKGAGESAAFTMGEQNVCGGTRLTLANKPYPDHVTYGVLHNQIKRGGGAGKDQTDRRSTLWLEMFGGCVFY
jgi:hypothetical protein